MPREQGMLQVLHLVVQSQLPFHFVVIDYHCTTINQSINMFNVLGDNWDPTDKKFSSVNSYRHSC